LKIGSWKLAIGSSSLFQGWIKENPFPAFVLLSILVHLIFIGITRQWNHTSVIDGSDRIEFDYSEIGEDITEEEIELPEPAPPEVKEELPEPEYLEEEVPPPDNEPSQIEPEIEQVIIPSGSSVAIGSEDTPARALGKYISYLQDIIYLKLEYPDRASREGRVGEVTVLFTLDNTGQLLALSIPPEGKAAFHPFNRAALNAVREAAHYFDAFPEIITEETITFRLPIEFSLN
jgi:TonB family protein